ncbi:unnamed protein product [Onchocerca flexuosa]|uniref:Innexin n=1 Tax=Onchocerca flexuosa TaxID=387005 RepID=A0A183I6U4_9BILA|nr:unnamed protein product [Onchocerca flexuosa]
MQPSIQYCVGQQHQLIVVLLITVRCPPLKGLDPEKNISKWCHSSGRWMGKVEGDFSRPHGWTNFTMCFTQEVISMMNKLTNGSLVVAQEVARNARKLEFAFLCEAMFFMLEYFKTVAFCWMFIEGFYLHNKLVLTVFATDLRIKPYLMVGYGKMLQSKL